MTDSDVPIPSPGVGGAVAVSGAGGVSVGGGPVVSFGVGVLVKIGVRVGVDDVFSVGEDVAVFVDIVGDDWADGDLHGVPVFAMVVFVIVTVFVAYGDGLAWL